MKSLIAYCPRLRADIPVNDKTPITDGHIDVYVDGDRKNEGLHSRVAVQVKGRAHQNKKVFKAFEKSFAVDRSSLTFLRDNQGGIYFYVAIHPDTREERVFYAALSPFKIRRLIDGMRPDQQTLSISLKHLDSDVSRLQRILDLAVEMKKQNVSLGFDPALFDRNPAFSIFTADGIDLSRPAELSLESVDFAVVLHTEGGLNLPVDCDLKILPANYVAHETELTVACADVQYSRVIARQLNDDSIEFRLSASLELVLRDGGRSISANLDLAATDDLEEQLRALEFFLAAGRGDAVRIDDATLTPESTPEFEDAGLRSVYEQYQRLAELLRVLSVPLNRVRPNEIDNGQLDLLRVMHKGLVLGDEVYSTTGTAGRLDVMIGTEKVVLMVLPGSTPKHWQFIDLFLPEHREKFRLYSVSEDGQSEEIAGTAYEPMTSEDLAITLNLRLPEIVDAYATMSDPAVGHHRANYKILDLIKAADLAKGPSRSDLLQTARNLNDWLIREEGEQPPHLINRWQIQQRSADASAMDRRAVRDLRTRAVRDQVPNPAQTIACCAILLGDPEEIEESLDALSPAERGALERWPIWSLRHRGVKPVDSGQPGSVANQP